MAAIEHPNLGDLRPSQIMTTFGIGAIVELPYISALVMGLDDWPLNPELVAEISEPRLLQAVRWALGHQVQRLLTPPVAPDSEGRRNPFAREEHEGLPIATFPRWMLCPRCALLAPLSSGLFKLDVNPYYPDRTRYVHTNCNKAKEPVVVPARFLAACENGHLDDFPWVEFVHRGPTNCHSILRLIEFGPGGEARDVQVQCDTCKQRRRLQEAFGDMGKASLPMCRGRRPHLRDYESETCGLQVRAIVLGASNLWFPTLFSSLAIPQQSEQLAHLVEMHWSTLQHVHDVAGITLLRQIGQLGDLADHTDDEIWQAIAERREHGDQGADVDPSDLKTPEWRILAYPDPARNTEDFRLRLGEVPQGFAGVLDKVVLVERMREVRAMIGFTRIDAPPDPDEAPTNTAPKRMRISRRDPEWVPAAETRGEGIFIQFREAEIQAWLGRPAVRDWAERFASSHEAWRRARGIEPPEANYPGLRYVLLHSFAHALMRQLTLECGYNAASVRERIYSRNPGAPNDEPMAGVLIYTAAPDSEGTLGGLVGLGKPEQLGRHITVALHHASLCASDPLCAEHPPSADGLTLHAAACHACMFAPETSCERGNKYLDRSVLAPTVERGDLAFFQQVDAE
ncbi:MAG TPA: DUF1998 domain-containing protein [Anaerolineae bacterium]|nr:DUF1998 domain-containing protein [Anaerolineae bacterium]